MRRRAGVLLQWKLLAEGNTAFADQDWQAASRILKQYLAKHPNDVGALTRYAESHLGVRPLQRSNIRGAIHAYLRLLLIHSEGETAR